MFYQKQNNSVQKKLEKKYSNQIFARLHSLLKIHNQVVEVKIKSVISDETYDLYKQKIKSYTTMTPSQIDENMNDIAQTLGFKNDSVYVQSISSIYGTINQIKLNYPNLNETQLTDLIKEEIGSDDNGNENILEKGCQEIFDAANAAARAAYRFNMVACGMASGGCFIFGGFWGVGGCAVLCAIAADEVYTTQYNSNVAAFNACQ